MKYQSEIIKDLIENNGHHVTTNPHYEVDCINEIINDVRGSYPKLCDYMGEWMNYANEHVDIGKFPIERVTDVTNARFENVVPYGYKSAILKGETLVNYFPEYTKTMAIGTGNWRTIFNGKINIPLTPNTSYLFINNSNVGKKIYVSVIGETTAERNVIANLTTNIAKFTTPDTTDNFPRMIVYLMEDNTSELTYDSFMVIPYQEGMENWDIPYFTGMQSVKMPVLTTSNEDGTKTNILTVNEEVELHGIGDVQDTLDCLTGEVTERIGEIVLDGSEHWLIYDKHFYTTNSIANHSPKCMGSWLNGVSNMTQIGVMCDNGVIRINLNNINDDIQVLKNTLSQNPLILQYELKTPTIKTVDLSCLDENNTPTKFKPYEGVMYVQTSSETLSPLLDMEVPVEAISQNLASFIK